MVNYLPEYIVRFKVIMDQTFSMNEIKSIGDINRYAFYFFHWNFSVRFLILVNHLRQITLITVLHLNVHTLVLLNSFIIQNQKSVLENLESF